MDARALSRLRPRDDSSAALRSALEEVKLERQAAEQRRDTAQSNRRTALTDLGATPKDIAAFEQQARDAGLELERLSLIAPDLEGRLAEALQREQAQARQVTIETARAAYAEAATTLREALVGYPELAEAIAHICELEKARAAALEGFHRVAGRFKSPNVVDVDGVFLAGVVLPAADGTMIWGRLPPVPIYHPYRNQPPGPYS